MGAGRPLPCSGACYFTEGESVTLGQRLFLIDPAPFQADLASARAARASGCLTLRMPPGDTPSRMFGQPVSIARLWWWRTS